MPAASQESRQLIDRILKFGESDQQVARTGMKTTNIAGYPLMLCWGVWGGTEPNNSGTHKAFLFLPYVQSGQQALNKIMGGSSMESPVEMIASNVENPYNCKVNITPSLNVSPMKVGSLYWFIMADKPAGFSQGGNTMAYRDSWIMNFSSTANELFKDYMALFNTSKFQLAKFQEKLNGHVDDDTDNTPEQPAS